MARAKLSASRIARLTRNGRYGDGGNLWLQVTNNGAGKSWLFRWTERGTGRERMIGLGSYDTVDVERARELARGFRRHLLDGKDPALERKIARGRPRRTAPAQWCSVSGMPPIPGILLRRGM